jgi:hypothetical protein
MYNRSYSDEINDEVINFRSEMSIKKKHATKEILTF